MRRAFCVLVVLLAASAANADPIDLWQDGKYTGDLVATQSVDVNTLRIDFQQSWIGDRLIWDGIETYFGYPSETMALRRGLNLLVPGHGLPPDALAPAMSMSFGISVMGPAPDVSSLDRGNRTYFDTAFINGSFLPGDAFNVSTASTRLLGTDLWQTVISFHGLIGADGSGSGSGTVILSRVPEPGSLALLALGLGLIGFKRRTISG